MTINTPDRPFAIAFALIPLGLTPMAWSRACIRSGEEDERPSAPNAPRASRPRPPRKRWTAGSARGSLRKRRNP